MKWLIQSNLYNPEGLARFERYLQLAEVDYSLHTVIPFSTIITPEPEVIDNKALVFGALSMQNVALERGYIPGAFVNHNFDYKIQVDNWRYLMLNSDAKFGKLGDTEFTEDSYIRPIHDTKSLIGKIYTVEEFNELKANLYKIKDDYSTLDLNTGIIVSAPKEILSEYRFFIVGEKISTYSTYRIGNMYHDQFRVPDSAIDFVNHCLQIWKPHDCFCLDIADTNEGYRIIEVNGLTGAGFYNIDLFKLIIDLKEYLAKL